MQLIFIYFFSFLNVQLKQDGFFHPQKHELVQSESSLPYLVLYELPDELDLSELLDVNDPDRDPPDVDELLDVSFPFFSIFFLSSFSGY